VPAVFELPRVQIGETVTGYRKLSGARAVIRWLPLLDVVLLVAIFTAAVLLGGWALAQSTTDTAHAGRLAALEAGKTSTAPLGGRLVRIEGDYARIREQLADVQVHAAKTEAALRRVEAAVIRIEAKLER